LPVFASKIGGALILFDLHAILYGFRSPFAGLRAKASPSIPTAWEYVQVKAPSNVVPVALEHRTAAGISSP